ncbi:hypothetical protein MWU50_04650 [Flavobacteriaceae bacterium S0862]|nr:hypothetical protein [Flavobacteriaceae bacterium S0862]
MKKSNVILLVTLLLAICDLEAQCAMCRAVLESEDGQKAAEGINNGIVYLMLIPYILIGGIGLVIYRKLKQK